MTRWLPHPILAAFLLTMWLLLAQSLALKHVLLGGLVAVVASWGLAALRPEPVRFNRSAGRVIGALVRLLFMVAGDIIRSNIAVGRIILFGKEGVSEFVRLQLDIENVHALALLAGIITATPGTLWVQYDRSTGMLLVHVLDLKDKEEWVRHINQGYGRLLQEIFA
jgi:multicomponent K+:H+ antiporter subunit E